MKEHLNILFLEDTPADAELEVYELRQAGLEFDWRRVDNEADFRTALYEFAPDLILADYSMPQFDAPGAIQLLKSLYLDIPVIVVTGTVEENAVIEIMKQGAADYLLKDRLTRLGQAVRHALHEKELRDEKRALAEQLVRLTEHAQDIIFRYQVRPSPELEYINPAVTKVLGYSVEECYAGSDSLIRYIHPEDVAKFWQLTTIESQDKDTWVLRMIRKDGSMVWVEQRNTLICDRVQQIIAIEGIMRDVTERKRLEEETLRAELLSAELENEKELTDLKDRFTSMVSHEFRTPLTVILSSADLLEQYQHSLSPEKQERHWRQIKSQVRYMVGLLDDVLTLTKARAGKLPFNPKPLNISQFCQTIVDQIQLAYGASRELLFDNRSQQAEALLDEQLLQHILINLLSNAFKYSPPDKPVRFDIFDDADCLVLQIADQGIGIPPEDQTRMFEVFHRAKNAPRSISGTGLGLSIVKNSVDLHGGEITCDSQEGVGTTFTVRLPLHSESNSSNPVEN